MSSPKVLLAICNKTRNITVTHWGKGYIEYLEKIFNEPDNLSTKQVEEELYCPCVYPNSRLQQ
jgi:hypothetical protein